MISQNFFIIQFNMCFCLIFQRNSCLEVIFPRGSFLFHHHQGSFSSSFYKHLLRHNSFDKKIQSQTVTREKLLKVLPYEKATRNMMMKLTQGWSISTTFYKHLLHTQIPKAQKRQSSQAVFLRFWDMHA